MKRQLSKTLLYAALLMTVFVGMQWLTTVDSARVTPVDGLADLSALDLSRELAHIVEREWEYYPGHLYTPEDFARGLTVPPRFGDNAATTDFGTYRLRLTFPARRVYAMTGRSFLYSQRVFIDGELVDEAGSPGESRDDTVPGTKIYIYHFMPERRTAEIVFQVANFHHHQGARNTPVRLAEPPVVGRYRMLAAIRLNVVVGCLVTVFFYFTGMFIFFSRRRHFLYIAVACLTTAARILLITEKHIMTLFPALEWFLAIRAEYLCLVLFVVALQLYFDALYPGMLSRRFIQAVVGLSALYALAVILGDTLFFTVQLRWYSLVWATASLATLWKMTLQLRRGDLHTILIFTGLTVFVACAAFDEITYRFFFHVRTQNTLLAGMLVCVFMNMIALTLGFATIEEALAEAENRRRELDEANHLLDRLGALKTRFLANVSHEMKTPLTVMSVHAQLSKALLDTDADRDEIRHSLDTISREAARLARMVSGVLDLGAMRETQSVMESLDLGLLLRKCAEVYRVIVEKKGNSLALDVPDGLPFVHGNADMLAQVVFNLLANANRHTEGGEIALSAAAGDGAIAVAVRDSGSGVAPEIADRVFERGVHEEGGDGAGLGLPIGRSIVERHGGRMEMESAPGRGTTVRFTVPEEKGEGT